MSQKRKQTNKKPAANGLKADRFRGWGSARKAIEESRDLVEHEQEVVNRTRIEQESCERQIESFYKS